MEDLVNKYFNGELTEEEKLHFFEMLEKDSEMKKKVAQMENTSALISMRYATEIDFNSVNLNLRKLRLKRFDLLALMKYVAVAIISIVITSLTFSYMINLNNNDSQVVEFSAPSGQRARVVLEDGTEVLLNANSTLRYLKGFGKEKRVVALSGEAFFDVKKDKGKEFIVKTSKMDIIVTGTRFNVNAYPSDKECRTSLVEGSIKVACGNNKKDLYSLTPNQQIIISGSNIDLTSFDNMDFMAWTEGIFIFSNQSLEAIVKKLQLYYDVNIVIERQSLRDLCYTGKFRQRDGVENVLKKLQIVSAFKYERNDDLNVITLY